MMRSKLGSTFSQSLKIVFANPVLRWAMLVMSYNPPRAGTWNDFQASLIGGIVGIGAVFLFRQLIEKDRDLSQIQLLPEMNGFQYAASIFICAEVMALSMVLGHGLANIYQPRPIDWAAFIGLTVLKNLILAVPLGIWGWHEHSKLRNTVV